MKKTTIQINVQNQTLHVWEVSISKKSGKGVCVWGGGVSLSKRPGGGGGWGVNS